MQRRHQEVFKPGRPMKLSRLAMTVLVVSLLPLLSLSKPSAQAETGRSEWWEEIGEIKGLLDKQKWKHARRSARSSAKRIIGQSWHDPELGGVLTELALARAIAEANLGNDRAAVWYWHIAINLDFRMRDRELDSYGRAASLLEDFPLRSKGEIPVGYEHREVGPLMRSTPPRAPNFGMPTILENTSATQHIRPDFHAELLIDKQGAIHHPVVISTYSHPIIQYAVLEWILELPAFEPRTLEGKATDGLSPLTITFRTDRR